MRRKHRGIGMKITGDGNLAQGNRTIGYDIPCRQNGQDFEQDAKTPLVRRGFLSRFYWWWIRGSHHD